MDMFDEFPDVAEAIFSALKIHEERGALNFSIGGEEYVRMREDVVVSCSQFEDDVTAPLMGCAMKVDKFNSVPALDCSDSVWNTTKLIGNELRNRCLPGIGADPIFHAFDKTRCNVPLRHVVTSYQQTIVDEYKVCGVFRDPPPWVMSVVDEKAGPLIISTNSPDRYVGRSFPIVEPSESDLVISNNLLPHRRGVFFSPAYAIYHAQAQLNFLPDRIQLSYVWKGRLKHRFLSRDPHVVYIPSTYGTDTLVSLGYKGDQHDCSLSEPDSASCSDEESGEIVPPPVLSFKESVHTRIQWSDDLEESHTDYFFCVKNAAERPAFAMRVEEQVVPLQFFQHMGSIYIFSGILGRFSSRLHAGTIVESGTFVVTDVPLPVEVTCNRAGELFVDGHKISCGRTFAYKVNSYIEKCDSSGIFYVLKLHFIAGYSVRATCVKSISDPGGEEAIDMWEVSAPVEELCVARW